MSERNKGGKINRSLNWHDTLKMRNYQEREKSFEAKMKILRTIYWIFLSKCFFWGGTRESDKTNVNFFQGIQNWVWQPLFSFRVLVRKFLFLATKIWRRYFGAKLARFYSMRKFTERRKWALRFWYAWHVKLKLKIFISIEKLWGPFRFSGLYLENYGNTY